MLLLSSCGWEWDDLSVRTEMESVSLSSLFFVVGGVESCFCVEVISEVEVEELLRSCWCCREGFWLGCYLCFGVIKVGGFVVFVEFLEFSLKDFLLVIVAL